MSAPVTTRSLAADDAALVSALHARVFGPGRFARTAYRVREGTPLIGRFCRGAFLGERLIAALRLTEVTIGGEPGALLLGPLAVDPDFAGEGWGRKLVSESVGHARADGVPLIVLVGDEPYYARFGFKRVVPGSIGLPGPVDPSRLLAAELTPGAAARFGGLLAGRR
jgi:predicted N-acetyltransferase YhbS